MVFYFAKVFIPTVQKFEKGGFGAMAEGTVKWFNEKKGYGFISQDDGEDLFVHHTGITGSGFRTLYEGQRVRFEIETSDRGPKAKDVEIL